MGHRLPNYDGICSSAHGHNFTIVATVREEADEFIDFKKLDGILGELLEDFDHAMVLYVNDPLLALLQSLKMRTVALTVEPTTEAIAQYFFNELNGKFVVLKVAVSETAKYTATVDSLNLTVARVGTKK
jgi:6-pyruvoyl-tetrahydropterin synthase